MESFRQLSSLASRIVRRPDPLFLGIGSVLGIVGIFAAGLTNFAPMAYPDPGLMYALAEVGIAVVFAFLVEAVWLAERARRDDGGVHRQGLGIICGGMIAGLTGVAAALLVGAHRTAGHGNVLDMAGLWWSVGALAFLACMVVIQPLLVDLYRELRE